MKTRRPAVDAALVVGGRFHDFDYARRRLLELLAEHDRVRTRVWPDYADTQAIAGCRFLVSYTCDVRPDPAQQEALARFVAGGGRWLALHGTNAALELTDTGVRAPRVLERLVEVLGSRFVAHPPIAPYRVEPCAPGHPLVDGLEAFETDDELYLCELPEPEALVPLLDTRFRGEAPGFEVSDWRHADRHLVMYLRPYGEGAVLYHTLGHCRGHYDMRPITPWVPRVERGSWRVPAYLETLRRGIRWALGELG